MQEVSLFIRKNINSLESGSDAPTRIELFKDEQINLTSTIQNVRDIKKVFTDFTHNFQVPASKTNNKVFKHYYNFDLKDGFDARYKADAFIQLNGLDFRKGKLRLNSVKMKNNKAYSYNLTFFGNTVTLKEVLGEDELSSLDLSDYDHLYNDTLGRAGLEKGLTLSGGSIIALADETDSTNRHLVYPLISHTTGFEYDGSGFHNIGGSTGIAHTDLKPAIKCSIILDAIESKYGLTFTDTFFGTKKFTDLYMWLHRERGGMTSGNDTEIWTINIDNDIAGGGLVYSSGTEVRPVKTIAPTPTFTGYKFEIDWTVTVTGGTGAYTLRLRDLTATGGSGIIAEQEISSGTATMDTVTLITEDFDKTWDIEFELETEGGVTAFDPTWVIRKIEIDDAGVEGSTTTGNYNVASSQSPLGEVIIRNQIPKMKVIDFLTNIWRMFNLTAYIDEDGDIEVMPLDTFYGTGEERNITKYIDVTDSEFERLLPHREIDFKYAEASTLFAINWNEIFNGEWGSLQYRGGDNFDGDKYDIEIGFEHMLYERMYNGTTSTEVMWGWFVDENQDPVLGEPLVFYNENRGLSNPDSIVWAGAGANLTDFYNSPQNATDSANQTINFNTEIDEYDLTVNVNSLFERYYKTYIRNIFSRDSRLFKASAHLPLQILLNYELRDTFIIDNQKYRINQITTNLQTGKSDLELYHYPERVTYQLGEFPPLEHDTTLNEYNSLVQIDSTHFILAYRGADNDGFIKTFEIDKSYNVTELDSLEHETTGTVHNSLCMIDSTHFVLAYSGPTQTSYIKTFSIDGSYQITQIDSLAHDTGYDALLGDYSSICKLDSTHVALAYAGTDADGFIKVFSVDGSYNITQESSLEHDLSLGRHNSIAAFDSTHVVLGYRGAGSDGFVKTFSFDGSWAITQEDSVEHLTTNLTYNSVVVLDSSRFALAYTDDTTGYGRVKTFSIDGSYQITQTDAYTFDSTAATYISLSRTIGNHLAVAYAGSGDDGYIKILKIAGGISEVDSLEHDTTLGTHNSLIKLSSTKYALAYSGTDSDGFMKIITIDG